MAFDKLGAMTFGFMLVPFLAYIIVVRLQWGYAENSNYRKTVLATRAALFLPMYAILMWIPILAPDAFMAFSVLINLMEAYSFYTFFSLITYNLGGPAATVNTMIQSGKEYALCSCCFPGVENKELFYRRNSWLQFHMLFTRVILTIIAAIAFYSGTKGGKLVAVIIQVICAAIVITMVVHLLNLCKSLLGLCVLCNDDLRISWVCGRPGASSMSVLYLLSIGRNVWLRDSALCCLPVCDSTSKTVYYLTAP
jgi:hypothetical protein